MADVVESRSQVPGARRVPGEMPRIIFVGSYGRSGSTLLGRMLGEAESTICVGESRYVWSRGLIDNADCGCGAPFRDCGFWQEVGSRAFGGWDALDSTRLDETDQAANVLRALPAYWLPRSRPLLRALIDVYVPVLRRLYCAIAEVSGAKTLVEISKDPTFAYLLGSIPDSDVKVVHLVRDSRAVAYSWTRRRREVSPIEGRQFMPRFTPAETAAKWLAYNGALQSLSARLPYQLVSYERFMRRPAAVLAELEGLVGDARWSPPVPVDDHISLGEHHMFSGNPMRTSSGSIPFSIDEEWRRGLPARQVASVTALTWPLLRSYGYPITSTGGGKPLEQTRSGSAPEA